MVMQNKVVAKDLDCEFREMPTLPGMRYHDCSTHLGRFRELAFPFAGCTICGMGTRLEQEEEAQADEVKKKST